MKKLVLLFVISLSLLMTVRANNVKLEGTVTPLSSTGSVLTMSVDLSWDNSWRDDYNWDAVWLFFKYKVGVDGAWQHATLNASGVTVTPSDYSAMSGSTSTTVPGIFIYPSKEWGANSGKLTVQVDWQTSTTKAQMENNDVFVVAHAVEMVYIPYGAYALGDGSSNGTFTHEMETKFYGPIPESSDLVDNNSGYTITASHQYTVPPYDGFAIKAADHLNCSIYPTGSWNAHPATTNLWWKIDFKTQKTIRYFGVSGAMNEPTCAPSGIWYLEGSNDDTNWTKLSTVSPDLWSLTSVSYPIQQSIAVTNPVFYRYYRIYMPTCYSPVVQNIAMTEDALYVADKYDIVDTENGRNFAAGNTTLNVPAVYPKGYQGFYVMKYETSQEQYVEFLNTLTLAQQTALIPGVDLLNAGDFVFGANKTAPNYRNGVVLAAKQTGKPLKFDNNLNNNQQYSEDGDGGTLAMNYMSISDAAGYASWAGLRPLTEMEYEKACRRPYPQEPVAGEYAWNSATGAVNATGLTLMGSGSETVATGNVNANNAIQGPVRCGIFARSTSPSQVASGATYWGVMEMSGNLSELCANITHTTISKTVNGTGAYNAALFGITPTTYGTRGGGFSNIHTTLFTSDRSAVSCFTDVLQRDSSVGFRCAYTYGAASSVDAGTIAEDAKPCLGTTVTFSGTPASASGVKIAGYIWSVNEGSGFVVIPGEIGATLTYSNFVGGKTYTFKRKAICPLGEKEVTSKSYVIPNTTVALSSTSVIIDDCGGTSTITATCSGASFVWSYSGTMLSSANTYTPSHADFNSNSGSLEVICTSNVSGCESVAKLQVDVPMVVKSTDVTLSNCGLVSFKDSRDEKIYCTRKIGNQCWMGVDLQFGTCNVSIFDSHWGITSQNQIAIGYYGVCRASTQGTGYLYNWQAAMNSASAVGNTSGNPSGNVDGNSPTQWQGICPAGWHLPSGGSTGEIQTMYSALGGVPAKVYPGLGNGEFRGIFAGYAVKASVQNAGSRGYCWSSTYLNTVNASCLAFGSDDFNPQDYANKFFGFTVRCVKDY